MKKDADDAETAIINSSEKVILDFLERDIIAHPERLQPITAELATIRERLRSRRDARVEQRNSLTFLWQARAASCSSCLTGVLARTSMRSVLERFRVLMGPLRTLDAFIVVTVRTLS